MFATISRSGGILRLVFGWWSSHDWSYAISNDWGRLMQRSIVGNRVTSGSDRTVNYCVRRPIVRSIVVSGD